MLKKFIRLVGGDPNRREIDKLSDKVALVNQFEAEFEKIPDDQMILKTVEFKNRIEEHRNGLTDIEEIKRAEQTALEEILPEAFAVVREASKRTIGLRHFDVQLIGGMVLHQGKISEMRTGEGKTLVATLPLYLNALLGRGTHLITVNDYLARRDARWMAPIFNLLGLSVGVLQMAARTENGKKAFLVDRERESPHEDQHQLRMVARAEAYAADITYGTNSEFGFDYLRDNMTSNILDRVQRGHYYAIIDEVDNVLIDEARTPLIISGPAQDEGEWYVRIGQLVKSLRPEDYEINEKDRTVTLTELGEAHIEELLEMPLRDPERPEDATPEQERIMGYLEQALRAQYIYRRNKDYLVQAGKVVIIDEFTGRMMPGRRWSDGLHQAVEAKEGVKVQSESITYATITIQNYFRMYQKLAGMSGTAITEAEEFDKIYSLGVIPIPTNLEYQALQPNSSLQELEAKDELGYKYHYYTLETDPQKQPVYWKRKDYPDVVYRTVEMKLRAICHEILLNHALGRPMLVGTTSVENSELLSNRLRAEPLRRLAQVLILRESWIRQNNFQEDGRQIPTLQFLNGKLEELDLNQMRKLARELERPFVPDDPANLDLLLDIFKIPLESRQRLTAALNAGIPHQVLNARKHTEESQIIASAGEFGAVTIATNMAGRGVDIKLGGELAEEIVASVNRVLNRAGFNNAYEMTHLERREALKTLDPADYGIYDPEIGFFFKYLEEMEQVRQLGGLHVIGSERHEARRIDNQLRGRAARQGDPGSSRFFLSMEDDLMRLFGGQQADAMMQRLKIDDALPLEMGLVSRLIEQSQTRVEGANFDVRKHLLEYDDVLNAQRTRIYSERDRVFKKSDLTDDVIEMLRVEVARRVPEALKDEGGPWRLLAWLEQIQPSISLPNQIYPTFNLRLLIDHIQETLPANPTSRDIREALRQTAQASLQAEAQHLLQSIDAVIGQNLNKMETQIEERRQLLDTFFEGLELNQESGDHKKPAELAAELNSALNLSLKLNLEQQRSLQEKPKAAINELRSLITREIHSLTVSRLINTIEIRIGESLNIRPEDLDAEYWGDLTSQILKASEQALDQRIEKLVGENGQITKDLDNLLSRLTPPYSEHEITWLLLQIPQGSRSLFDRKTHRRIVQRTNRLTYIYHAASMIDGVKNSEISDLVLEHLEGALQALLTAWGSSEFNRLAQATLSDLEEKTRQEVTEELGLDGDSAIANIPFSSLDQDLQSGLSSFFGRRLISNIYRQLLLGVITELWVEYLTQMEALRVSIGLEAYAQRDPLVQYKARASELFRNLQSNIRLGVISRMFTYKLRNISSAQAQLLPAEGATSESQPQEEFEAEQRSANIVPEEESREQSEPGQPSTDGGRRKRRRKR